MDPDFDYTHWWLGLSYLGIGEAERGLEHLRRAAELPPNGPKILGALGHGLSIAGYEEEARTVLQGMLDTAAARWFPPYDIAMVCVGLGDADRAFEWLEKAFDVRDIWLAWVNAQPEFKSLRDLPRFRELLRRMNYPGA